MYSLAFALSLFSLLSVLSPGLALSRPSRRWSSPFVTASGTKLMVNGHEFKFVGTNAYWLPYLNSDDDIHNTLANMSNAGINVVRTWAFNDVTAIPNEGGWLQLIKDGTTQINTGPNGIQRLDKLIEIAKSYNIYVYFSLTNNWFPSASPSVPPSSLPRNFLSNDYGGMDAYVQEFGVSKTHDEFYTDMNIREKFFNYVQFVVSRYAHEPTVIAWELANDARCNSTLSASEFCNTNIVTQWHADTSNYVRSIDSNHLITAGTHGFFCPTCPKLFPPPPPPAPSPAPGGTGKRKARGPMTPSRLRQMVSNERRSLSRALIREGKKIRGRWTVSSAAKRQANGGGAAFNGVFGVDSQDILNAPHIDFGTFQLFPDQNNYATTGTESQPPSADFANMLSQTTAFINTQADTAQSVGKPMILTAFGLVTQDNVQEFVPFNANCPVGKSSHQKRQTNGSVGSGSNQQQINTAYSNWLQSGLHGGVSGMNQYQWSSQNLVPAAGTVVQGSNPNPSGTVNTSPNDGYGILQPDTAGVQQVLTNASQTII